MLCLLCPSFSHHLHKRPILAIFAPDPGELQEATPFVPAFCQGLLWAQRLIQVLEAPHLRGGEENRDRVSASSALVRLNLLD